VPVGIYVPRCPPTAEALVYGIIAIGHLLSTKPRRVTRASLMLVRCAPFGLCLRHAASQNQR
jgi:NADH:ubiquinone oxidoreductase subunit B-like Fe-S oxidoreductase